MRRRIIAGCFLGAILLVASSFTRMQDGHSAQPFRTKKIGAQEWMMENLNVSHFRNGDPIFEANDDASWEYANIKGIPAWCYYNNNPEYGKLYGKLYNGWAIIDKRGIGPEGWHVPKDNEWTELEKHLGTIGGTDSDIDADEWKCWEKGDPAAAFKALPGGYRTHEPSKYYGGPFYEAGSAGYWWSASGYLVDNFWVRRASCEKDGFEKVSFDRTSAFAVRLVKNPDDQ